MMCWAQRNQVFRPVVIVILIQMMHRHNSFFTAHHTSPGMIPPADRRIVSDTCFFSQDTQGLAADAVGTTSTTELRISEVICLLAPNPYKGFVASDTDLLVFGDSTEPAIVLLGLKPKILFCLILAIVHLDIVSQMLVRTRGLEPPRISPPAPQAGAATNYATYAFFS